VILKTYLLLTVESVRFCSQSMHLLDPLVARPSEQPAACLEFARNLVLAGFLASAAFGCDRAAEPAAGIDDPGDHEGHRLAAAYGPCLDRRGRALHRICARSREISSWSGPQVMT
jgi:hypothetical protein